jgi:hypothetical protein
MTLRIVERIKKAILLLSSIGLALVLGEIALRLLTPFPIHPPMANTEPHEKLLYVMDSRLRDVDSSGFRNPEGVTNPELITIGDSHTYGYNVARAKSWPYQAARELSISVYNYGVPGYGVLQYLYLFEKAVSRKPRHIILGLYPANDLDDYCKPRLLSYWDERLAKAGFVGTTCGKIKHRDQVGRPPGLGVDANPLPTSSWRNSALLSAVDHFFTSKWMDRREQRDPLKGINLEYGEYASWIGRPRLARHRSFTDLDRPTIREAYEVTQYCLERMIRLAGDEIRLSVLLIPSRENVLFEAADEDHPLYGELKKTVFQERKLTSLLDQFLRKRGVATTSPIHCLQSRFRTRLYPAHDNGHPTAAGYRCYAEAAANLIRFD